MPELESGCIRSLLGFGSGFLYVFIDAQSGVNKSIYVTHFCPCMTIHRSSMSDERKDITITVRVDRSLKSKMDERPEINWSGVARKAIRGTIEDLEVMDEIAAKNRMTEADVTEVANEISERVNERTKAVRETKVDTDGDRTWEELS